MRAMLTMSSLLYTLLSSYGTRVAARWQRSLGGNRVHCLVPRTCWKVIKLYSRQRGTKVIKLYSRHQSYQSYLSYQVTPVAILMTGSVGAPA